MFGDGMTSSSESSATDAPFHNSERTAANTFFFLRELS